MKAVSIFHKNRPLDNGAKPICDKLSSSALNHKNNADDNDNGRSVSVKISGVFFGGKEIMKSQRTNHNRRHTKLSLQEESQRTVQTQMTDLSQRSVFSNEETTEITDFSSQSYFDPSVIMAKEEKDKDKDNNSNDGKAAVMDDCLMKKRSCLKVRTQEESISNTYHLQHSDTHNATAKDQGLTNQSVGFSSIEIHIHSLCLGDNPSVRDGGPPLSISWDVSSTVSLSVDDYEFTRPERRHNLALIIPKRLREDWLYDEGFTYLDLRKRIREMDSVQRQRQKTAAKFYFFHVGYGRYLKRIKKLPIIIMKKLRQLRA